jgi:ubiquinone/menaquinone biosynthesis C-methylase UbiE
MILRSNLPKLAEITRPLARVLDVGGGRHPFNPATHVMDVAPYAAAGFAGSLDGALERRFTKETWIVHDACAPPWPFPDKFFDFAFCSHLLEDVRDPIAVCAELTRVAKAGYVETPSRAREIFAKARFFEVRTLLGKMPEIGFAHHRWFVEAEGAHLRFTAKDQRLMAERARFITRRDLGRKMSEAESGLAVFWEGAVTAEEIFIDDAGEMLGRYRNQALAALKQQAA